MRGPTTTPIDGEGTAARARRPPRSSSHAVTFLAASAGLEGPGARPQGAVA